MTSHRAQLIEWIEQAAIPAGKISDALIAIKVKPDGRSWRVFIERLLLWLGGLALSFSVMFFIAYNWKDIGYFAKFGMVEAIVVLAVGAYCKIAENTTASKVSLFAATICLGVLLALYGQTYQTGADPWQLFFCWALLILPWTVIGRFPAMWIFWISLVNISIILYSLTFRGIFGMVFRAESGLLWLIFLFNTLSFIVWQVLAKIWHWLRERWAIRLLAVGSGAPLTWLVLFSILDYRQADVFPLLVWALWLLAMYIVYRKVQPDLFMLAGCCLSLITVTVTFLGKHMFRHADAGAFLFLAMVVIGMGAGAAFWLKKIHQESQS